MTLGRAALISLMQNYLDGLLDTSIMLLEVHKLMYLMQTAGEPLRLKFVKGPHGPYAENLRHAMRTINNQYIMAWEQSDADNPCQELGVVPSASDTPKIFLMNRPNTRERLKRVSDLAAGFETRFGLELLAAVHWVVKNENVQNKQDLINAVYLWNPNKHQYSRRQIHIAANVLSGKRWIETLPE